MRQILVFGSNLQGRHKGGAAKAAKDHWGAIEGLGRGIKGNSYALPTMTWPPEYSQPKPLSLNHIQREIRYFLECAKNNMDKLFILTPVGTGIGNLTQSDLFRILNLFILPENVVFSGSWLQPKVNVIPPNQLSDREYLVQISIDKETARFKELYEKNKAENQKAQPGETGVGKCKDGEAYVATASGGIYHPFAPRQDEIHIGDIAHHLANVARWSGATRHKLYYKRITMSVAEHSVLVARHIELELGRPDLAFEALLHDAAEAYIGDLVRPLKYSEEFKKPFADVEKINEEAIAKKFGLPYPMSPEIKQSDDAVCMAEWDQIVLTSKSGQTKNPWAGSDVKAADVKIEMLSPFDARTLFFRTYNQLLKRRNVPVEPKVEWYS